MRNIARALLIAGVTITATILPTATATTQQDRSWTVNACETVNEIVMFETGKLDEAAAVYKVVQMPPYRCVFRRVK